MTRRPPDWWNDNTVGLCCKIWMNLLKTHVDGLVTMYDLTNTYIIQTNMFTNKLQKLHDNIINRIIIKQLTNKKYPKRQFDSWTKTLYCMTHIMNKVLKVFIYWKVKWEELINITTEAPTEGFKDKGIRCNDSNFKVVYDWKGIKVLWFKVAYLQNMNEFIENTCWWFGDNVWSGFQSFSGKRSLGWRAMIGWHN